MHHFMDFTAIFSDDHCASVQQEGVWGTRQTFHNNEIWFDRFQWGIECVSSSWKLQQILFNVSCVWRLYFQAKCRWISPWSEHTDFHVKREANFPRKKKKVKQLTLICNFRWSLARSMTYEHVKSVMTLGNHYSLSLSHYVSVWVTAIITLSSGEKLVEETHGDTDETRTIRLENANEQARERSDKIPKQRWTR